MRSIAKYLAFHTSDLCIGNASRLRNSFVTLVSGQRDIRSRPTVHFKEEPASRHRPSQQQCKHPHLGTPHRVLHTCFLVIDSGRVFANYRGLIIDVQLISHFQSGRAQQITPIGAKLTTGVSI